MLKRYHNCGIMRTGRVYKIIVGQSNECYVGSTFDELRFRFRALKSSYKLRKNDYSVFKLFDKYGVDGCRMILIKEYEVVDREHLNAFQQLWINRLKSINKRQTVEYLKRCTHNRLRWTCSQCNGASTCEHGRRRNLCVPCNGASICEHRRQRNVCKSCNGASMCEHGRQRNKCKSCNGVSICGHGRQRSTCKLCGGASICEHNRQRSMCKDCEGSGICGHGRQRSTCKPCNPGKWICSHCDKQLAGNASLKRHIKRCHD